MTELEKWKSKNKPKKRQSILKKHIDEIVELYDEDFTIPQISDYLSSKHGLNVTDRTIYREISKSKNFSLKNPQEVTPAKDQSEDTDENGEIDIAVILDRLN